MGMTGHYSTAQQLRTGHDSCIVPKCQVHGIGLAWQDGRDRTQPGQTGERFLHGGE